MRIHPNHVDRQSFDRLLIIYHLVLHSIAFKFMVIMYRVGEKDRKKNKTRTTNWCGRRMKKLYAHPIEDNAHSLRDRTLRALILKLYRKMFFFSVSFFLFFLRFFLKYFFCFPMMTNGRLVLWLLTNVHSCFLNMVAYHYSFCSFKSFLLNTNVIFIFSKYNKTYSELRFYFMREYLVIWFISQQLIFY